jgi:hypothetical protein
MEGSNIWSFMRIRVFVAGQWVLMKALITRLKMHKVFLGHDWLMMVNPEIDWEKKSITQWESSLELQTVDCVPDYMKEFSQVFAEEGFVKLPPR